MLAETDIVPAGYRHKPANILAAAMMGADLGWSLMRSLQAIHSWSGWSKQKTRDPVSGRITGDKWVEKPVTMLSSEGKLSLLRDHGHRLEQLEYNAGACCLRGTRSDNGEQITVRVTIDDARRAGLAPGEDGSGGKAIWAKYPRQMLFWRAVSELCGALCPDALMGLTANEQDFDSTPPAELLQRDVVDVELLERVPTPAAALEAGAAETGRSGGGPVDVSEGSAATQADPPVVAEPAPDNPRVEAMTAVLAACGDDQEAARDCWQALNAVKPWPMFDDHAAWAAEWFARSEHSLGRPGGAAQAGATAPAEERCEYRGRDGRSCVRPPHESSNHKLEPKSDGEASGDTAPQDQQPGDSPEEEPEASPEPEPEPEPDPFDDPLMHPEGHEPFDEPPGYEPRERLL